MPGQAELKGVRAGGDGDHENGSCQCTIESSTNLDAEPGELVPEFGPLEGIGANDGQQGGPHCSRSHGKARIGYRLMITFCPVESEKKKKISIRWTNYRLYFSYVITSISSDKCECEYLCPKNVMATLIS